MKVLLTGATGFVGHHLVAALHARGHETHALVLDPVREQVPPDTHVHPGNVCDADGVATIMRDVSPEWVMHLAGASSVGQSFNQPIATWQINLTGTLTVLEAVRTAPRPIRCLAVTSGEIYGRVAPDALPVTEETPLHPLSPYAASKAAADIACAQYHEGLGLDVIRVRAFNHIGPGQDPRFVVPSVAKQLAQAERDGDGDIEIQVGNVDTRRDFTDVRDMVEAYCLIMESGAPQHPYLACRGESVPIRALIDGLAAQCLRPVRVMSDPSRIRDGEQPDLYGSPARLTKDTGWRPRISLDTTLRDSLDWWRDQLAREENR